MNRVSEFQFIFLRDIDKFIAELSAYPNEESLWQLQGQVPNSAGNLCLHIAGNLQYFIGTVLGQTGYVRERDREFSDKDVPRAEILRLLTLARQVVSDVFGKMPDSRLAEVYPADFFGEGRSISYVLLHLLAHLNYHLGQLNYLRRS